MKFNNRWELLNIQSWGFCSMRDDLRDPVLLFSQSALQLLLWNQSVRVSESERAVDSKHQWAPLYKHLCNPLVPSFGHPPTRRTPLPSYLLGDDTFPQLPYQCTGIISQKQLAWEPDGDVWEGRGRMWKSNTNLYGPRRGWITVK